MMERAAAAADGALRSCSALSRAGRRLRHDAAGDRTGGGAATPAVPVKTLDPLLDDVQKRTFNFFWETAEPETGLMPDRWPKPPFSSIAAVGFALNAYAIGAERGYVTRAQARARVLTTLRFLRDAQQDTSPDQATGYQGFFYHFVNFTTGKRYGDSELSTRSTPRCSWPGCCSSAATSTRTDPEEAEIRKIADDLYLRVNWPWAIAISPDIRMAWSPELAVRRTRLARLQRGHAGVHPGARQPYLPRGAITGRPGPPTTTAAGARSRARPT